jgi:hypothetical protein
MLLLFLRASRLATRTIKATLRISRRDAPESLINLSARMGVVTAMGLVRPWAW